MATFHFTLKTDKKPDGTKVRALDHVEYVNRKGVYAETASEREKGRPSNNFITTEKISNAYDGKEALLYTSQYGDIVNTPDGIQVKHSPSIDTTCIALMLAHETMKGAPLVINGSRRFKELCVNSAVSAELPIVFSDEKMQSKFKSRLEEKKDARQRFRDRGGIILDAGSHHKPIAQRPARKTRETLASFRASLSQLSRRHVAGYMEGDGAQDGAMLLQNDGHDELDDGGTAGSSPVRRDFSGARRRRAVDTAQKIIKNIERNKDAIYASSHVEYINREKSFAKRGGCIHHEHRLPKWADDDPVKFFRAADMYERKNGCRYKEFEFALPNELTLNQNLELIRRFIAENLPDHYYAFAVHDKIGAMTDGTHNTHVHLMFSERLIDDCEKEEERTAKIFFSRANPKARTLDEKRKSGAPKSNKLNGSDMAQNLTKMRESYANIVNEMLKESGCVERVDHRSLKAQRQDALMRGDTFLAKLLDRIPEKHIRPQAFVQPNNPEVEALRLQRQKKQELQDLLFQADQEEKAERERRLLEKVSHAERGAQALMRSREYEENEDEEETLIGELRQNLLDAVEDFKKWDIIIVTKDDAERMAKLEMMTEDERDLWTHYMDLSEQEKEWKDFLGSIQEPTDAPESVRQDFRQLVAVINKKLADLDAELSDSKLQDAMIRLERSFDIPERKAILQRKISKILFEDKHAKDRLSRAADNLTSATESLRQVLFEETLQSEKKGSYTARELYDIARKRYYGLKKEIQRLDRRIEAEEKKVISMDRAKAMAPDVLTKGGFREYRKALRNHQKREEYYKADLDRLAQEGPGTNPADFEQRRRDLAVTRRRLNAEGEKLARDLAGLERIISAPGASIKLTGIAAGIVQKNQPQAKRVRKLRQDLVRAKANLRHAQEQLNAARESLEQHPNASYRVAKGGGGGSSGKSIPDYEKGNIILDALLGKDEGIPHVQVRLSGDDDYGMKDWTLMDEGTKEALRKKKMWREEI